MVPGGRGPGGGDPLAHHPICAGHWPNVRSRPLTRRPTACPATGKHQGTNFTTPRRQRVRAPGVVGRGGRSVAPRQAAASARPTSAKFDGDQSHRASEATSTWSPEGVARAAATHSHTTPSVWAIGLMYGRTHWHDGRMPGGSSVAPRHVAASARPTGTIYAKIDGDHWRRAREAASAWSPESVARAAATHSHTTPALCKAPRRRWRRVRDRSHSPNVRPRPLARRPDAPRLATCTAPDGSECTATSRTAPERQRARGPTPRPTSRAWHPCGARPLRGLPQCGHDSPQGVVP